MFIIILSQLFTIIIILDERSLSSLHYVQQWMSEGSL